MSTGFSTRAKAVHTSQSKTIAKCAYKRRIHMKTRLCQFGLVMLGVASLLTFTGCTPAPGVRIEGKATGGGSLAKSDGTKASFGFNGTSCSGTPTGRFNYIDKNAVGVPSGGVMANATISSIVQCIDPNGCTDNDIGICPTGAYIIGFDYKSTNAKNPGTGQGGACLVDGGEGHAAVTDQGAIGFNSGPYAGYSADGTVNGNIQGHLCAE
jgi:hypothetical protein